MPRPKDKNELQAAMKGNWEKLSSLVQTLPATERDTTPVCGKWTTKDLIAHLHEWHEMVLLWHNEFLAGKKPQIPAPGCTWKDTPKVNDIIYNKYKDYSFEKILSHFQESYKKIEQLIGSLSNEELFTKKHFEWTGTTSIGSYFVSCTSSHYDWALKEVRSTFKK